MVGCNKKDVCDCNRPVLCNSSLVKCWKTEVRVVSCGVSATDFPYDEDGCNQSNTLILSAYPSCVGNENKGCIALTDNCCETVQVLGDWASLSVPNELVIALTLNLNNGESYNFNSTTGIYSIKPCTATCLDNANPIFVAPAAAQPSPCLLLTLGQVVDYCNKTICWTLNVDVTSDCIGATTIGNIINVGCTAIMPGEHCAMEEYSDAYDFKPYQDDVPDKNSTVYLQNFVNAKGVYGMTLSKGIIVPSVQSSPEDIIDNEGCLVPSQLNSDVGLYNCQVYNFWAACYANAECLDATNQIQQQNISGAEKAVIKFTPLLQKRILNFTLLWQVKRPNDLSKARDGATLRFELVRGNSRGDIVPVTTGQLYKYLKLWNSNLIPHPLDNSSGLDSPDCLYNDQEEPGNHRFSSVFFIGIGDKCKPYHVFKTPSAGNDYQANVSPYTDSNLITPSPSAWFGLNFGTISAAECVQPVPPNAAGEYCMC